MRASWGFWWDGAGKPVGLTCWAGTWNLGHLGCFVLWGSGMSVQGRDGASTPAAPSQRGICRIGCGFPGGSVGLRWGGRCACEKPVSVACSHTSHCCAVTGYLFTSLVRFSSSSELSPSVPSLCSLSLLFFRAAMKCSSSFTSTSSVPSCPGAWPQPLGKRCSGVGNRFLEQLGLL